MGHLNDNFNATAGIIAIVGAPKSAGSYSGTVSISGCTSTAQVTAYRGFVGGIAGFMVNATIENCSYTGKTPYKKSNQINPYCAGIAASAINTTIKDCVVKSEFHGQSNGSCTFHSGAIVARALNSTVIEGCSSFSHVNANVGNKAEYVGAVVGYADNTCTIKDTRYGGSVLGTDLTANNYAKWIQGTAADGSGVSQAKVENCTFWNGE